MAGAIIERINQGKQEEQAQGHNLVAQKKEGGCRLATPGQQQPKGRNCGSRQKPPPGMAQGTTHADGKRTQGVNKQIPGHYRMEINLATGEEASQSHRHGREEQQQGKEQAGPDPAPAEEVAPAPTSCSNPHQGQQTKGEYKEAKIVSVDAGDTGHRPQRQPGPAPPVTGGMGKKETKKGGDRKQIQAQQQPVVAQDLGLPDVEWGKRQEQRRRQTRGTAKCCPSQEIDGRHGRQSQHYAQKAQGEDRFAGQPAPTVEQQEVERGIGVLGDDPIHDNFIGKHGDERLPRAIEAEPFIAPERLTL